MQVIHQPEKLRQFTRSAKGNGQRVALVPTMGFLHEGHLALVKQAQTLADRVIVSIFVNPTQFGPQEDLALYPRDVDGDLKKLEALNVDVVFLPERSVIYPAGFGTYVVPEQLSQHLCGAKRPGHFRGVCTVVFLLFQMSDCDVAIFGEKDFQQLQIIRRMVADLWMPVHVEGFPIVREKDGLAMSSRNSYLSESERQSARALSRALRMAKDTFDAGTTDIAAIKNLVIQTLSETSSLRIDYVEIVDIQTLAPTTNSEQSLLCAIAAFVGKTRLIDNCRLNSARD